MEQDFQKATLVSEIELGSSPAQMRTFVPPVGTARLILAVPNYRCSAPIEGVISFAVQSEEKRLLSARRRLSDLTWSHGEGSCDAYGYIAGSDGRFDIGSLQGLVTFAIDATQIKSGNRTRASVWLVYGDRVPTARIFGERK